MQARSLKQSMFMIFGAFATLIALLLVLIPPMGFPLSAASISVAFVGAVLCLYVAFFRMLPAGKVLSPAKFQAELLIAMAGAELVMLAGTFLGSGPSGPWPFAVVAEALMFGAILPKLIAFWRRHDGGVRIG